MSSPGERAHREVVNRAAADLARPVDVERPHRARRQRELVEVRMRHVLARELRDGVGPARLADRALRGDVRLLDLVRVGAEDLARREVDQPLDRARRVRGLEHVEGAHQVDAHRPHGALEHLVDARDRGHVDDVRGPRRELAHERQIEHVALHEAQVRVLREIGPGEGVAVQVVEDHDLVLLDQPPRQRGADEPRAAGHEDLFPAQSHDGAVYRGPRRRLRCRFQGVRALPVRPSELTGRSD